MDECTGYQEYAGGYSVHRGFHKNSMALSMTIRTLIMHGIPGVLMISPGVLNSPQCTAHIPRCVVQTLCRVEKNADDAIPGIFMNRQEK